MMETIERLEKAVDFLSSTGSDCLGIGTDGQIEWSLRDELIDSLNKIRADVKSLQAERDKLSNLQRYEQTLNMANKEVTIELTEDPNGECVLWADIQEILDGES